MKSLSVHGIDDEVLRIIMRRAKKEGKSVNKIMKDLMARGLGLAEREPDHRADFAELCGVWTEEEAAEFVEATADLETTETEDWR